MARSYVIAQVNIGPRLFDVRRDFVGAEDGLIAGRAAAFFIRFVWRHVDVQALLLHRVEGRHVLVRKLE